MIEEAHLLPEIDRDMGYNRKLNSIFQAKWVDTPTTVKCKLGKNYNHPKNLWDAPLEAGETLEECSL